MEVLIEKRLKVVGQHSYITIRSKKSVDVPAELLRTGFELVDDKKFETLARIDSVRVPVHSDSMAKSLYCNAIVVENVLCDSTTAAYEMAKTSDKSKWEVVHMEGTKNWGKETPED